MPPVVSSRFTRSISSISSSPLSAPAPPLPSSFLLTERLKNFDTQLIPSLQPLVDESGADAIVGTHVDAQGSVRCGQVATKSTKNQKKWFHAKDAEDAEDAESRRGSSASPRLSREA